MLKIVEWILGHQVVDLGVLESEVNFDHLKIIRRMLEII